jgi:hypothetical protein
MIISNSEQLTNSEPGRVEVEGTAGSFKGRAFVVMDDGDSFCFVDGQRDWPDGIEGTTVRLIGDLRIDKPVPDPVRTRDELVTQGIEGWSYVLSEADGVAPDETVAAVERAKPRRRTRGKSRSS